MLYIVIYPLSLQHYITFRFWWFSSVKVNTVQILDVQKCWDLQFSLKSMGNADTWYSWKERKIQIWALDNKQHILPLPSVLELCTKTCFAGKMSSDRCCYCSVCTCFFLINGSPLPSDILENKGCFSCWMVMTWCIIRVFHLQVCFFI